MNRITSAVSRASALPFFQPALALASLAVALLLQIDTLYAAPFMLGAVLTEAARPGCFIISEARGVRSRDNITVLADEVLLVGHVLGRRLVGPTYNAAVAGPGNTGDGVFSAPEAATNLGAQRGTYTVVFVEPASDAGTFIVYDPAGRLVGKGNVAVAFDNQIKFTIADGEANFVAGDSFTVEVSGGTYKYQEYDPANADGGQRAVGVLFAAVDATGADKAGVAITRDAELRSEDLEWFDGATSAQKAKAIGQLALAGIIVRD